MRNFVDMGIRLAAVLALTASSGAIAQSNYPERPVQIVIPYSAGGTSDQMFFPLAERMTAVLGKPVLIVHRPGAAGNTGNAMVAKSPADGYTLLMATSSWSQATLLYKNLPYRMDDFTGVALVAKVPLALSTSKSMPANTLREFVDYAKARPGQLNYGSLGIATNTHILSEAFTRSAGIQLLHVPYPGSAPALTALINGNLHMLIESIGTSAGQQKGGNIKILGLTSPERIALLPDIPTLTEQGYPFAFDVWYGILAPAATPRPIVDRLNEIVRTEVRAPAYRGRLEGLGISTAALTANEFNDYIAQTLNTAKGFILPLNLRLE